MRNHCQQRLDFRGKIERVNKQVHPSVGAIGKQTLREIETQHDSCKLRFHTTCSYRHEFNSDPVDEQ